MSTLQGIVRALGLQVTAGMVTWLVVASVAALVEEEALNLPAVLLLFAQLVIVPLGLPLAAGSRSRAANALVSSSRLGFRIGAIAALAALAIPRGDISAAVAALYLVPSLLVGVASVMRAVSGFRDGGVWRAVGLAPPIAAGAYLVVGALFFVLHRQGATVAGFPDHIIQLTAVHFHFTGFGLMLMAGALARHSRRIGAVAVLLLLLGLIVTPIGFLSTPVLQATGALVVVAALIATAAGTLAFVSRPSIRGLARPLLITSSVSPIIVGGLAAVYAISESLGQPAISLPIMASLHGAVAAIGVVFCGLFGWRLAQDR